MARIAVNWANDDIEFSASTNFDIDNWEKYMTKGAIREMLKDARAYVLKIIDTRFLSEVTPKGHKWKKLHPLTVAYKGNTDVLKFTGKLRHSPRVSMYANELRVTTKVPYAGVHQKGGSYKATPKQMVWMWNNLFGRKGPIYPKGGITIKIPARPFFGFNKTNEKEFNKLLLKHYKKSERMGS